MPAAEPFTARVIEAERSDSTLVALKLVVFSGAMLESAAVVRTPPDPTTLDVERTSSDDSGRFVLRGRLSEAVMSTPSDLVVIVFCSLVTGLVEPN